MIAVIHTVGIIIFSLNNLFLSEYKNKTNAEIMGIAIKALSNNIRAEHTIVAAIPQTSIGLFILNPQKLKNQPAGQVKLLPDMR